MTRDRDDSVSWKAIRTVVSSIVFVVGSILSAFIWWFLHEEKQDLAIQSLRDDQVTDEERIEHESRLKGIEKDIEYLKRYHKDD